MIPPDAKSDDSTEEVIVACPGGKLRRYDLIAVAIAQAANLGNPNFRVVRLNRPIDIEALRRATVRFGFGAANAVVPERAEELDDLVSEGSSFRNVKNAWSMFARSICGPYANMLRLWCNDVCQAVFKSANFFALASIDANPLRPFDSLTSKEYDARFIWEVEVLSRQIVNIVKHTCAEIDARRRLRRLCSPDVDVVYLGDVPSRAIPRFLPEYPKLKFVISKESSELDEGIYFRITCVGGPLESGSPITMMPQWAGSRGATLVAKSNIADALFCHHKGYLAGARTYEGAVMMINYVCTAQCHGTLIFDPDVALVAAERYDASLEIHRHTPLSGKPGEPLATDD
jgi:hypothetical protein